MVGTAQFSIQHHGRYFYLAFAAARFKNVFKIFSVLHYHMATDRLIFSKFERLKSGWETRYGPLFKCCSKTSSIQVLVFLQKELILNKLFPPTLFLDSSQPDKRFVNITDHIFNHWESIRSFCMKVQFYESLCKWYSHTINYF